MEGEKKISFGKLVLAVVAGNASWFTIKSAATATVGCIAARKVKKAIKNTEEGE